MGCRDWLALVWLVGTGALASGQEGVAPALQRLVNDPRLAGARVGVHVVDLADDDAVLAAHDAEFGFMTASNMKLISSATALLTLGPDFRFRTHLLAHGAVRDGVLLGDLELVGDGDPTLGGRHEADAKAPLRRLAAACRAHGIRRIRGRVLGNDDCQPDEVMGDGWSWAYQGAAYAAQVSGLCFAENYVTLQLLPAASPGAPAQVRLTPPTRYLTLNGAVTTAARTDHLVVDRRRASNQIELGGTLASGSTERFKLSVENPTAFAAHELREALLAEGIGVDGPALDRDAAGDGLPPRATGTRIATVRSKPLREILITLNKVSQNLYAEQVIRTAARHAGRGGSMRAAREHAVARWAAAGVDLSGSFIADGSGLTRLNLVRPRQFTQLLAALWRGPHRTDFTATLPIAGIDGTLGRRFTDGPARGRVRAKTGYISRVVALSGFVPRPAQDAAPLVFSLLLNNFDCPTADAKDAIDTFVQQLARHAGHGAAAEGSRNGTGTGPRD